jgi:bis(5'-nucleosidyl)-tetraphosphatase
MRKTRSCGFLLVRGDPVEAFLLMKHNDRWDLPKGHIDPGETDMQCALRETEEETGITAADLEILPDFQFTAQYPVVYKKFGPDPAEKTLLIFLARLRRNVSIKLTEHPGYQWFNWHPPHKIQKYTIDPVLAKLAEYLEEKE